MNDHVNQLLNGSEQKKKATNDVSFGSGDLLLEYKMQHLASYIYCNCENCSNAKGAICAKCGKKRIGANVGENFDEQFYDLPQHVGFAHFIREFEKILGGCYADDNYDFMEYSSNQSEAQVYSKAVAVIFASSSAVV